MVTQDIEAKRALQESQYSFPYHYIPTITPEGDVKRYRILNGGYEYLCYQFHVLEKVKSLGPNSVLEVGCGDGYFIGALGDEVSERAGVDYSTRALAFAQAFNPGVEFYKGDASNLSGKFDVVVAIEVLEHIPDKEVIAFIKTLFERTKVGGHIVISVPSNVRPVSAKHFRHYDTALLREQITGAGFKFEIVSEEYVCRIPRWIRYYNRLTSNRYLFLDIPAISRRIWRRLWRRHRVADASGGRHVVAVVRRHG